MRETLYLIALAATGADVVSTAFGISAIGWARFHESNIWLNVLWPTFGYGSLLLYWPFEAAIFTVEGLVYYEICRFAVVHSRRWLRDDYYAWRVMDVLRWTPLVWVLAVPFLAFITNFIGTWFFAAH